MNMSSLNKNSIWIYGVIYWSIFLLLMACEDESPSAAMDTNSSTSLVMNEFDDQMMQAVDMMARDLDFVDMIVDEDQILPIDFQDSDMTTDLFIPPDYDYSEVTRLSVQLSQNSSQAGEGVTIRCLAFDQEDRLVENITSRALIFPAEGWELSSDPSTQYIAYQAQSYQVTCSAPQFALRSDPVTWEVTMGELSYTVAQVTDHVIRAGEQTSLSCLGIDAWGNQRILSEEVSTWEVSPPTSSLNSMSNTLSIERAGEYQVACLYNPPLDQVDTGIPDVELQATWIQVHPSLAHSMSLSIQPQQEVYALGQVITLQTQVWDEYQNIITPTQFIWQIPVSFELFSSSSYRLTQEGEYNIRAQFEGPSTQDQILSETLTVQVDSNGPNIICEAPSQGSMQIWQENLTLRGTIVDRSEIDLLLVDGVEVMLDPSVIDDNFEVIVHPRKGLNWHTITAIDIHGNSNEVLCSYIVADDYLAINQNLNDSIIVNLGVAALDDDQPARPIQSMTDLFRVGLEASDLEQELNQEAVQQNPIIPSQCFQTFFSSCVLRLSANFNNLSLGSNQVSLQPQGIGDNGALRFLIRFDDVIMNLTIQGSSALGGINTTGDISVDFIEVQGDFSIDTVAGVVQVSLITESSTSRLGDIDSNFSGLSGTIIDIALPFFESYIRDSISQTIEDAMLSQIDTTLSQAFSGFNLSDLSFDFDIIGLNGENISVSLNTSLSDMSVNEEGLKIALDTSVEQSQGNPVNVGRGIPILHQQWPEDAYSDQMTMRLRLALINQLLYVLWESGFFSLNSDDGGLQFDLQAPPIMTWKGEGNFLALHFGPASASFSPSDLFPNAIEMMVLSTLESEVSIDEQGALNFARNGLRFDEFDIYVVDLMMTPDERQAVKDEIGALIIAFANEGLSNTLPSLPLPSFALPPELNLPADLTLGLRDPDVSVSPRAVTLSGRLGE
jgi:hypothetical protein